MNKNRVILTGIVTVLSFTAGMGVGPTVAGSAKNVESGLEMAGGVSITYQAVPSAEDMADTIYKLQQRAGQCNAEAHVYQEGSGKITIELSGAANANALLVDLGKPCSLEFKTEDGTVVITDTDVETASALAGEDNMGNKNYSVELLLTEEGAKKFGVATADNIGEAIYIIYNGETISYPTIEAAITNGVVYITNIGSQEAAENMASNIRIGSLSVTLEELSTNVVDSPLSE